MSATVTAPAGANLTLRVVEARFQDAGRARARLDPDDMLRLGASAGSVVQITGKRIAAATWAARLTELPSMLVRSSWCTR